MIAIVTAGCGKVLDDSLWNENGKGDSKRLSASEMSLKQPRLKRNVWRRKEFRCKVMLVP